jgi:hypothetical protein
MLRGFVVVLVLVAGGAFADVGPRPAECQVPASCTSCLVNAGLDATTNPCVVDAADAGLVKQECSDRSGAMFALHFCPAGVSATRGCAMAPGAPLLVLGLLALRRLARR